MRCPVCKQHIAVNWVDDKSFWFGPTKVARIAFHYPQKPGKRNTKPCEGSGGVPDK